MGSLVDNPVELSLADIAKLGVSENITMHHCIQAVTGIAKWGGLPMKSLIELVRPKPNAKGVSSSHLEIHSMALDPTTHRKSAKTYSNPGVCLPRR